MNSFFVAKAFKTRLLRAEAVQKKSKDEVDLLLQEACGKERCFKICM